MNKPMRITLSAALLALLAGCGAKGPLILPQKAVPIEVPADAPTDNTPQIEGTAPVPADEPTPAEKQAEDVGEDPASPVTDD